MKDKYYEDFDLVFSSISQLLNKFCKSKILNNYFSDAFESFIYANLINNFFSNLNNENIEEYKLSDEEITNIKNEFEDLQKISKKALSLSLEKKIDERCYNSFKNKIQIKFPNFIGIIEGIEELIDINDLNKYLKNKKDEMESLGKTDCDAQYSIFTKAIEEYVKKNKSFPDLDDPKLIEILSKKEFLDKIAKETLDEFSKMKLKDWDIWHSNSSYYIKELQNPELIAMELIKMDICPLVFSSNTEFWYKENNHVKKSKLEIKHLDMNQFSYKASESPIGYPRELLKQATEMWYHEWKLFNENYRGTYPYLRCFFNACYLKKGPRTIALYPQIKIYANGVYNLLFREIAPTDYTYYLEPFIENEVNLPKLLLDSIEIPPEIIKYKGLAKYESALSNKPIHLKMKEIIFKKHKNILIKNMEILFEKKTKNIQSGDFSFKVIPFKSKSDLYLDNLCRIIISAFTYTLNQKNNYYLGSFWTLRPSVYILDFINQPSTSSEIIEEFGDQLGKIMSRVSTIQANEFRSFLGKNLRENFEDYTLHINEALTLWTISKKGLVPTKNDPNRGNIIYEKQVQVEAIDHLYLSHRRLFEKASLFSISYFRKVRVIKFGNISNRYRKNQQFW